MDYKYRITILENKTGDPVWQKCKCHFRGGSLTDSEFKLIAFFDCDSTKEMRW